MWNLFTKIWNLFAKSGKRCVCGSTNFSRCSIITEEGKRLRAIRCKKCNLPHQDISERMKDVIRDDRIEIGTEKLRKILHSSNTSLRTVAKEDTKKNKL